jgi:fatty acid desaturase
VTTAAIEPAIDRPPSNIPDAKALAKRMGELKALARDNGYFNIPLWEQAFRILELVLAPIVAFTLLTQGGGLAVIGMIILGIHYPRAGYLAHDIAHGHWGPREDAKPRLMLDIIELTQGFGPTWWVEKHELHHAFPNGCRMGDDGVLIPIDGDIDTAPWLVWDKVLADYNDRERKTSFDKAFAYLMPRLQVVLFFPILSLSRFNWSTQSILTAWRKGQKKEAALCTAHWIFGLALAGLLTPGAMWTGWAWFLGAQFLGGFILAVVFVLNHTGMEVYDAGKAGGFYDRQARSTRNTPTSLFHDWATGGLNSQIEHHMFPTLARRNLPKMRAATRKAMEECGYAYAEMGNQQAMRDVLKALSDASKA